MRSLKFKLDRKSLELMFVVFIPSLLKSSDVIFNNISNTEKQELDKIQNEAARIVNGTTKLLSIDKLYNETGWLALENRHLFMNQFGALKYSIT